MAVYKYIGRSKLGEQIKGSIEADGELQAATKIRALGINPREIKKSRSIFYLSINLRTRVKMEHFVVYCRQFATLIRAGVSIIESNQILAEQTESKALKHALLTIGEEIRTGITFTNAAIKFPKVFPLLFINMMRAGEATGNIDETLERLASSFEKSFKLKKKIQSAMMYPLVLMTLIIAVVIFMLVWVVPQFTENFEKFGAELPKITVIVLAFSQLLQTYWLVIIMLVIIIIVFFIIAYKKNKRFNYIIFFILLRFPVFGIVLQKSAIARMMRTLASLFSSSVPILEALTIIGKIARNPIIEEVIERAKKSLESGSTLAQPLEQSWVFPPLVTQMISIGEKTGALDYMLQKVAEFYEDDVDRTVDSLKSLLEPLMILILASVVGFIVASVMLPMFSLYEQM